MITERHTVVIPAYNAANHIEACLIALNHQTVPKERYQIIVVDDGSTDETADIVKRFDVKYIHQPNAGPASARNLGAQIADGEIILFTDSDCVAEKDWIEQMVLPFEDSNVAGVKGAYRTHQRQLAARFAQIEFEDRYDLLLESDSIDMLDTYSAAIRKSVFDEMKGFDESFPVANNEDTDLSYRLCASGYKIVFSPKAIVYHTHPDSLKKYLTIKFWRGYWRLVVYKRFPGKAVKDSYTPKVIKIQTVLMAMTFALAPLLIISPLFLTVASTIWISILITGLPFSVKAYRKDRLVGLLSPIIIFLRSLVFAAGSLMGLFKSIAGRP
jgi:GT2 family glycosyltransferase